MAKTGSQRQPYLDNIRLLFCLTIVIFHSVRAYADWWWFVLENKETSYWLTIFIVFSNAVSMSFFFLLSGYFTEPTYNTRDFREFQNYRVKRFVPPVIVYATAIISFYVATGRRGEYHMVFGHLWFLEHILIYGFIYSVIRRVSKNERINTQDAIESLQSEPPNIGRPFPSGFSIILFMLGLAFLTFLARIWFRISEWALIFYFFQAEVAHLPHYIAFFVLGILAFRNKWFSKIPKKTAIIATIIATGCMIIAFVAHANGPLYASELQTGWTLQSFLFSTWETVFVVSLMISLLYFFRIYLNNQTRFIKKLSMSTYDVYIAHVPISGLFQMLLMDVPISLWFKILLVIPATIICSFTLSFLIRIKRNRKILG